MSKRTKKKYYCIKCHDLITDNDSEIGNMNTDPDEPEHLDCYIAKVTERLNFLQLLPEEIDRKELTKILQNEIWEFQKELK